MVTDANKATINITGATTMTAMAHTGKPNNIVVAISLVECVELATL